VWARITATITGIRTRKLDLHSPTLFGFFWSHVGWIVSDKYNETRVEYIATSQSFRSCLAEQVPPGAAVTLAVVLWLIGGWPLFIWGFCLSTVLLCMTRSPSIRSHTSLVLAATKPVTPARTMAARPADAREGCTITIITSWLRRARASSGGKSTSPTTR